MSTPVVVGDPTSGDFEYFFDTAGRFYREQYPDGKQVTHQLDANGNATKMTYPDGYYIDRVFDELNRLVDIKLNGSGTPSLHFDFDAQSRRTKLTYGNGVTSCQYGFEKDNDLTSLIQVFNGSAVTFTHKFNNVGELTGHAASDSQFIWHPSAGGTASYGTANNMNQYPTVGGVSQTYNTNGCLTGDGIWTYGYDTLNHLTSATKTGVSASYLYDPAHRQGQKTVGSTKTRYIYAGFQRIAEYDGTSGSLLNRFVSGVGMDEALIQITAGGTISYFHHDRMGNIIATADNTGAVTNKYKYSSYGESAALGGTTFGFQGQRYDAETGLYYMKMRYYDPKTGRFLQPDPKGFCDSLNLYTFVLNNPNNYTDPFGLELQVYLGWNSVAGRGGHLSILFTDGTKDGSFTISSGPDGPPLFSLMDVRRGRAAQADLDRIWANRDNLIPLNVNGWNVDELAVAASWLANQYQQAGVYDFSSTMIGNNGNAFAFSILNMLGVDVSSVALPGGRLFPGWGQDIPLNQFGIETDLYLNHNTGRIENMGWGRNTERPSLYYNPALNQLQDTGWGNNGQSPSTYTDSKGDTYNSEWGNNPWENNNPWGRNDGAFGTKRT